MSVSARLSRTLHQALGDDAAEDLVNWMVSMDANRVELREYVELYNARIDSRFAEERHSADARFAELRLAMETGFSRLETKIESRFAELLKWSFVFWVGAVGAVAALAGVLR